MARPTPEELAERRRQMDAVNNMGGGGSALMAQNTGATTSALQQEQPPIGPTYPPSGPVGAGNQAPNVGTPAANGASQPPSAGPDFQRNLADPQGTPQEMIDKMAPGEMEEALEASAAHVGGMAMDESGALSDPDLEDARVKAKKRAVGEAIPGAQPRTALEKERDSRLATYEAMEKKQEITPQQHDKLKDKWRNIFDIIPEEDFGLVLMDFGFRAMMAGETMGSAAAIGAAGAGALGGVAQRRDAAYNRDVEQFNMADEGARGALEEGRQSNDTINTEKGVMEWKDGTWQYVKDNEGKNVLPSALAGRPPVDEWKINQWVDFGMSRNDARLAAMSGVTPQQARDTALRLYMQEMDKFGRVMIPGKGQVKERDLTQADKNAYIDDHIRRQGYGSGSGIGSGGGGGRDPDMPDPNGAMPKGGGWDEKTWKEYQEIMSN